MPRRRDTNGWTIRTAKEGDSTLIFRLSPSVCPFSTRRNYISLEMLCLSQSHRRRREFTIMNYTVSHNCNRHCAKCSTGIISFNPAKTPQDVHYLLKKNGDIDGR